MNRLLIEQLTVLPTIALLLGIAYRKWWHAEHSHTPHYGKSICGPGNRPQRLHLLRADYQRRPSLRLGAFNPIDLTICATASQTDHHTMVAITFPRGEPALAPLGRARHRLACVHSVVHAFSVQFPVESAGPDLDRPAGVKSHGAKAGFGRTGRVSNRKPSSHPRRLPRSACVKHSVRSGRETAGRVISAPGRTESNPMRPVTEPSSSPRFPPNRALSSRANPGQRCHSRHRSSKPRVKRGFSWVPVGTQFTFY